MMDVKVFAQKAIVKGYTGKCCNGWEWIENNLPELDYIFQSEEYKKENGMKYKCMPILLKNVKELTDIETSAIETAWYLNNKIEHEKAKKEYVEKMEADGWVRLTPDVANKVAQAKGKLEVILESEGILGTVVLKKILRPIIDNENRIWLIPPRATRKGYLLHQFKSAFCKEVSK